MEMKDKIQIIYNGIQLKRKKEKEVGIPIEKERRNVKKEIKIYINIKQ